MPNFQMAVNAPQGVSYAAPLLDFSPIGKLPDAYMQGVQNKRDIDAAQAIKDGLPTLADGSIDYAAAAQMLAKTGNLGAVTELAKLDALRQKTDSSASLTPKIKEYEYAKKNGFTGSFEDFIARERGGAGEYGLTPVWGRDKDGNPVMLQPGKSGEAIRTKLPDGVSISGKDAIKIDAGTHWVLLDPVTRQQVGTIPKNIEGKEAAEERGKAAGQAQVALPNVITKTTQAIKLVDDMIVHPGRETATGKSSVFNPTNYIPGTEAKDFQVRAKQMGGTVFLEAFQSLKGGGAITEVEGQKAEAAIARLDRSQSDEAFLEALNELKGILRQGLINARKKASGRFTDDAEGNGGKAADKPAQGGSSAAPASAADPLADARDAIAKGADRNAVIQRLKQNGIDPSGL